MFLYLAITILKPDEVFPSPVLFALILGLVFLFLFVKVLIQLGNSSIFNSQSVIAEILFKKISYLNYSSLVLFFANVLLTYVFIGSKTVVFLGIALVLLILTMGWVTIIKTHLKFLTNYFFYFILYLCALEIAPIIIIVNSLKV